MSTLKSHAAWKIVALLAVILLVGCGGSDDQTTIPTLFEPVVHDGYAVYMLEGEYSSAYVGQDKPDHFMVGPGCYRFVTIEADRISTMSEPTVNPAGGIDWTTTVTRIGSTSPLPATGTGWVLGQGLYKASVANPAGGRIEVEVEVSAANLAGYEFKMIPVDSTGKAFSKNADGDYQVSIGVPFRWATMWQKNGLIVARPVQYSTWANTISGSGNISWDENGQIGVASGLTYFAILLSDEEAGGLTKTVGIVSIEFVTEEPYSPDRS